MNLKKLITGSLPVLLTVTLGGCYVSSNLDNEQPNYTPSEEVLARGEALYQEWCLDCHGPDLKGDGPKAEGMEIRPEDLTEKALHLTPVDIKVVMDYPHYSHETIKDRIKYGNNAMPPLKELLSDEQIDDLTLYVSHRIREADAQ